MRRSDGGDDGEGRKEKDVVKICFVVLCFFIKQKVAKENAPLDAVDVSLSISATLLSRAWRCLRTSFSRILETSSSISVMHCSHDT